MTPMRKVGRIASIGTSLFVGLAFTLPRMMSGQGGELADGRLTGGLFLFFMAAAAMIAVTTAIWGRVEANRSSRPYEGILLVPLIIVVVSVAMPFITAFLRGT